MPNKKLTDSFIRSVKSEEKRIEYYDTIVTGFALRVSPSGHKSFVYRYRADGKIKRFTIGKFPKISLSKARDQAKDLAYKIRKGTDPLYEKQKRKYQPKPITFSVLVINYKKQHLAHLRKTTQKEYSRVIEKEVLPFFSKLRVSDISRGMIVSVLDTIAEDRPILSNRVRAVISSILSFAVDKALIDYNPVLGIKRRAREVKRERVYSIEELQRIWTAIELQEEPVQTVLKMLLYCGQRSTETKTARWKDIDFDKRVWVIPEEKTKASRRQEVPFSNQVLKLLIKRKRGKSECVFESSRLKNEPIWWLQKASDRIKDISGVSDFRIHDLRRTAASYMAQLGTDRTTLGKVLNHKSLAGDDQVTAIYDRYDYMKEKREALQKWADYLDKIIG